MTNVSEITGNIFTSECQTLVNTVNCVGVMGAGIALEFKFRHPAMFDRYVGLCRDGLMDIGKLWLYRPPEGSADSRWVLNFPTKKDWKNPSKKEYLELGLKKFTATYRAKGVESVAFPALGAANGGLEEDDSIEIMQRHLKQCNIPVEIYRYDRTAKDDRYDEFRGKFLANGDDAAMAKATGLRVDFVRKVRDASERDNVRSISQLASVRGVGPKTLEKVFRYVMDGPADNPKQATIDLPP